MNWTLIPAGTPVAQGIVRRVTGTSEIVTGLWDAGTSSLRFSNGLGPLVLHNGDALNVSYIQHAVIEVDYSDWPGDEV